MNGELSMNGELGTNGQNSARQPWLLALSLEKTLAYLPV